MTVKDLIKQGYHFSDVKLQRGYVSRKTDIGQSEVMQAGGSRKGQFYVLAPCFRSTRYCYRQYFVRGVSAVKEHDIYYYRARLMIKKERLPVILKTDYPSYMRGDCIKKRFASGFVLTLRIEEYVGTDKPVLYDYLCFPQIISEI